MRLIASILIFTCFVNGRKYIWHKLSISWTFSDPYHLVRSDSTKIMISFSLWENALDGRLRIREAADSPTDIDIYFVRKEHGDREPLDGPGGLVAHSGLPPRGYLHLDADEKWSFDGETGIDIRYVILHETGHLLGLRHIWKKKSIMNPYYRRLEHGMSLSSIDIHAIQELYKRNHFNTR